MPQKNKKNRAFFRDDGPFFSDGGLFLHAQKELAAALNEAQERRGGENVQYSIGMDEDNRPFVEVEEDILAGVPENQWVKTVKENLKKKFPNGVTVGNNQIQIDRQTRREMTYSKYMQWLYNNDRITWSDKLRATNNADEIVKATTDWVNTGLIHERNDALSNFAEGVVLLRVGNQEYSARVVVGAQSDGSMKLYDVLDLTPIQIKEKETGTAKTENPSPGADINTATISSIPTIPQTRPSVNTSDEASQYSPEGRSLRLRRGRGRQHPPRRAEEGFCPACFDAVWVSVWFFHQDVKIVKITSMKDENQKEKAGFNLFRLKPEPFS